ncbi:Signal transduction histidine kinase [Cohnella sp. OV330]|uniref:sensor histidine kinase n=1 Tax=Cohnella sp. OV330 TaxID=1855288 RepID=UPI0008EA6BD2|nr:HAMP domain-containing sensor histidine kinase [Cohnella sp. OV330]SFB37182.1 Signal transduction histidine kinase [Cohnella sp. OV330]
MTIRKRLIVRYVYQLAAAGIVLLVLAAAIVLWMRQRFSDIGIEREFAPGGLSRMIQEADASPDGLLRFDPKLLGMLRQDGGWLQSLAEDGRVRQAFNAPADLLSRYAPGQLMDYWSGKASFPYRLFIWIQPRDGRLYTMLYGLRAPTDDLLRRAMDDGSLSRAQLSFPAATVALLDQAGAWVQVLDRAGSEYASWRRPETAPNSYTLTELAMRMHNGDMYNASLDSRYDARTGLTWIVHVPVRGADGEAVPARSFTPETVVLFQGIALFLLSAMLVVALLALWYGYRYGGPLLHMVERIRRMGSREDACESAQGPKPASGKKGKKRGDRMFAEMMGTIDSADEALRARARERQAAERHREEWIAGLSHDLKTPLSSIKGYAHLLASDTYRWTEEEMRQFALTIAEKSAYMDRLINDLALTYRLRHDAGAASLEPADIGALLAQSVQCAAAHPGYGGARVRCVMPEQQIVGRVHAPWFGRVVENLVANALIHNPPETRLTVELLERPGGGWQVDFRDDGIGMDAETASQLFERYYRGTDTDRAPEGSGLGMAIAKELVQAMGGRIEVRSAPGEGTTISLVWTSVASAEDGTERSAIA